LLFLVPAISQTHKSLENSQDFFCQDQDQDRDQDFIFFVLEAPRDQDFGLEDYITGYNYDSTSIRRPFDCLSEVVKVTVTSHHWPLTRAITAVVPTYYFPHCSSPHTGKPTRS